MSILKAGRNSGQHSPVRNNLAQAVEIVFSLERVSGIIEKLHNTGLTEDGIVVDFTPGAGTGVAAIEAPRGLLLHRYSIENWHWAQNNQPLK